MPETQIRNLLQDARKVALRALHRAMSTGDALSVDFLRAATREMADGAWPNAPTGGPLQLAAAHVRDRATGDTWGFMCAAANGRAADLGRPELHPWRAELTGTPERRVTRSGHTVVVPRYAVSRRPGNARGRRIGWLIQDATGHQPERYSATFDGAKAAAVRMEGDTADRIAAALRDGVPPAPERCPTCDAPEPRLHPAAGSGGEVTARCTDPYHSPADEGAPQ